MSSSFSKIISLVVFIIFELISLLIYVAELIIPKLISLFKLIISELWILIRTPWLFGLIFPKLIL